jgi:hypothetical protein
MTKQRDDWITVRQGANLLGISTQRMYQLVKSGKVPTRRTMLTGPLYVSRNACTQRLPSLPTPETPR